MANRKTYKIVAFCDTDLEPCDLLGRLADAKLPGFWTVAAFEPCREEEAADGLRVDLNDAHAEIEVLKAELKSRERTVHHRDLPGPRFTPEELTEARAELERGE